MIRSIPGALLILGLLTACTDPMEAARQAVIESHKGGGEFQFHDLHQYPGDVVCGDYLQMDKWGQSAGRRPFVYRQGEADVRPDRDRLAIFCTDDAAQVMAERLGIRLDDDGKIRQLTRDLRLLVDALERFYDDIDRYPDSDEGLDILVRADGEGKPRNYREGAYLSELPKDPWGEPYHYQAPAWGRVKTPYQLWTEGEDASPGGEGLARDIHASTLAVLEHVSRLN